MPDSLTMKFRLLFWMRGNGRAGSSPSGLKHRLDFVGEVLLEPGARVRVPIGPREQFDTLGVQIAAAAPR